MQSQNPPRLPSGIGKVLPEESASFFSKVIFQWVLPFMQLGFSRPLMKEDLWELPPTKLASTVTDAIEANFYARCRPDQQPHHMRSLPAFSGSNEKTDEIFSHEPPRTRRKIKYDASLFRALLSTFTSQICRAGFFKLCGDTLVATTPLVTKVLLVWLTKAYTYHRLSEEERGSEQFEKPQGLRYGIGIAFSIFAMQQTASLMTNHYFHTSQVNGLLIRTSLIGVVLRKSLRLSGRSRLQHSIGKITTMISSDASRLDLFTSIGPNLWISPIQIVIAIVLLLKILGYSALVGIGVIVAGIPVQFVLVKLMHIQRKKLVGITDDRIRLTTEVLQGIRLIKLYAWEAFYANVLGGQRSQELGAYRRISLVRSILIFAVTLVPISASVLAFITYALTGHDLNIAVIFSSFQLFNIIRQPFLAFPTALSAFTDALVALNRISEYLIAEELGEAYPIDVTQKEAVYVDGDFSWETVGKDESGESIKEKEMEQTLAQTGPVLPTTVQVDSISDITERLVETPFELRDLKLNVQKGSFIAIVGRVGSGKSSVLQALAGEMRKTKGQVRFGGTVAYVPQIPWIRNATLRDNVLFGMEYDEKRFWNVIQACGLEHDLKVLPHGEFTEIGEKGINLSGGQKARVSLARAAYSFCDIVLLDDPLSAVDAHVSKSILELCILDGPLSSRTRILVTHALHALDKADYIYIMDNGAITAEGTFQSLLNGSVIFSRLMQEYGSIKEAEADEKGKSREGDKQEIDNDFGEKVEKGTLMQAEERKTGAVTWRVYTNYLRFAGGVFWAPVILILLMLTQGSRVVNVLVLGFWTSKNIAEFRQGDYLALYAATGVAQGVFNFAFSFAIAVACLIAGFNIYETALIRVLRSPTSFFDTTPIGRIISRFSKDLDTLDAEFAVATWQFTYTVSSVLGTVVLIFYTFPFLGLIFPPMAFLYWMVSVYYRRTSVETKRLDSLMRSVLYTSFSETLTGLSTIRAYRVQEKAIKDADAALDMQNRVYYMTISIQRWLSVRVDMLGNSLLLGIALFAVGFRDTVNPSKAGVLLSYAFTTTQVFSDMIAQFAQTEQNMNAVERVLHYTDLTPEGADTIHNDPPPSWPSQGHISFKNVKLNYRDGLPLVLKGVTFEVESGEKVGIVGRTGAGKSSLMQALLRVVELQDGKIEIDGQAINSVDLNVLRSRLALVPQDSTLFRGTLRANLDPLGSRTDAELISVLQRAWLLPSDGTFDATIEAKFSLDSIVSEEGSNFSAGEKQLLALSRALVKNSRIIILDEATSSVDVETDAKIQKTIQKEFATSTLLCIAHRLNTIAYYDRVLVMDGGRVAEFDTVLNLYDNEQSIFRSLCNEANLQKVDILRIRKEHKYWTTSLGG